MPANLFTAPTVLEFAPAGEFMMARADGITVAWTVGMIV